MRRHSSARATDTLLKHSTQHITLDDRMKSVEGLLTSTSSGFHNMHRHPAASHLDPSGRQHTNYSLHDGHTLSGVTALLACRYRPCVLHSMMCLSHHPSLSRNFRFFVKDRFDVNLDTNSGPTAVLSEPLYFFCSLLR